MTFEIEKLPKNTFVLKVTVPSDDIKRIRDHVIEDFVKEIELPGFRKGMAPRSLLEANLDEGKIKGEVINHAVSSFYPQVIKESHLHPIIFPRIEVKQYENDKDLIFEAKVCEKPDIKVGDYKKTLKNLSLNVDKKILGADGKPASGNEPGNNIDSILDAVASESEIDVPDLLVEEEVNHMLSRLIDQTGRLGMTVEQYLSSGGRTLDQIKQEYSQTALRTLKLEFLLYEIADAEKITATDKEISDAVNAAPDEKSRAEMSKEENKNYVRSIILKNKVIQYLVQLHEGGKSDEIKSS